MATQATRLSALRLSRRTLLISMVGAVSAVLGLGLWASGREMDTAIARLGDQQAFLALAVAEDVGSRIALLQENARLIQAPSGATLGGLPTSVLQHLSAFERKGQMLVLLREVGQQTFHTPDHQRLDIQPIHDAFARREAHVVIPREVAERVGLTSHRAVAGLATVSPPAPNVSTLQIAVVASAASERARVFRTQWRDVITGLTAIAVVLGFGRLTLKQQRRELELAALLERSEVERERDAQLSRADRFAMLAAMSTGIAHELGTPLSVIVGRLEQLALIAANDERAARAIAVMSEQTERMNHIIRGFLALARGETPIMENTSPESVVAAARELVRHRFESAEVALAVDLQPLLPQISLDARLFTQAIVNLLVNACDASRAGDEVLLRVRQEDKHVIFEVIDRGQGISAEVAKRATEPFFTTRAGSGGTGLGLAIANEITQQHGGTLELVPHVEDGAQGAHGTSAKITISIAAPLRAASSNTEGDIT